MKWLNRSRGGSRRISGGYWEIGIRSVRRAESSARRSGSGPNVAGRRRSERMVGCSSPKRRRVARGSSHRTGCVGPLLGQVGVRRSIGRALAVTQTHVGRADDIDHRVSIAGAE